MWYASKFVCLLILSATVVNTFAQCDELQALLSSSQVNKAYDTVEQNQLECDLLVGQVYLRKGRNDLALQYFDEALNEAQSEGERADALQNLSIVYWNTGNYTQAEQYINEALRIQLQQNNEEKLGAIYNDYGLIVSNNSPKKALENYEKATALYKSYYGPKNEKVVQALINSAMTLNQLEFFGEAILNLDEAFVIARQINPSQPSTIAFIHFSRGIIHTTMGQIESALKDFETALGLYQDIHGDKHPDLARVYNMLGTLSSKATNFEEAINYFQKAIQANTKTFQYEESDENPKHSDYLDANTLLNSLFYKAQAFENYHFNHSLDFKDLKTSMNALMVCDTLIDKIRQVRTTEADKIALGEVANQVYESGALLGYTMADLSLRKDEYFERSFYFAEKSKSAVLLESIADASAKSFAGIPQDQLEEEARLKAEITYNEQLLLQNEYDESISRRLFQLKNELNDFITQLETQYPAYFNLKYNVAIPNMEELQQQLKDNEMIVSYYLADQRERILIFQITSKKFKVENVLQTENFKRYLRGFRNSIYFQDNEVYQLTANALFERLFPGKIPKSITDLTIIPSDNLGTIPFEALLTSSVQQNEMNYGKLPYLINDYNIAYAYAAVLYLQNMKTTARKGQGNALLCAPINFENASDLPSTASEIENLNTIFKNNGIQADLLINADANEHLVKNAELKKYNYLHFATHGQVDADEPARSRIFLNKSENEDGSLYSGEIYNLQLDADLVTLSACETGLGQISKGEGIIGLTRALVYAGADNLIVSLWEVADNSTSEFMKSFYSKLQGQNYRSALNQAKVEMLNGEFAHPFYWAPFVLIGK